MHPVGISTCCVCLCLCIPSSPVHKIWYVGFGFHTSCLVLVSDSVISFRRSIRNPPTDLKEIDPNWLYFLLRDTRIPESRSFYNLLAIDLLYLALSFVVPRHEHPCANFVIALLICGLSLIVYTVRLLTYRDILLITTTLRS